MSYIERKRKIYIYIYIERERGREIERNTYIFVLKPQGIDRHIEGHIDEVIY